MKIVTYNVNGLRQRVTQFGSLGKLLNSLDADIICFQETKLSRQELTVDLTAADGYEAFFSCTRTVEKGRVGYSGVATFCRVKSAFSSNEVALPLEAEEGFTGLLEHSRTGTGVRDWPSGLSADMDGLENVTREDLVKMDNEGRCIITDHGHFVLFNLYGPRAEPDDEKRIHFKMIFYKILQRRWEFLLSHGKRVLVAGDLNIAPFAIDRSGAELDFENNEFRKWLRSMLVRNGGPFFDAFRAKHPQRRDAYTCWPQNTGAEELNHGSRIDHILMAGPCFHQDGDQGHDLLTCHVSQCDILTQFKRWKSDIIPRWNGQRTGKLEGSDHVPVFACLQDVPDLPIHNISSLAARYFPEVRGRQQTIVSLLLRRKEGIEGKGCCGSLSVDSSTVETSNQDVKNCHQSEKPVIEKNRRLFTCNASVENKKKKTKNRNGEQLTLKSFLQKKELRSNCGKEISAREEDALERQSKPFQEVLDSVIESISQKNEIESNSCQELGESGMDCFFAEGKSEVSLEWERIQLLMQKSLPLCVGHGEPCVKRSVKKGPNMGRSFYVCARAEGPKSNPEARCKHFQWASSKFGHKRK